MELNKMKVGQSTITSGYTWHYEKNAKGKFWVYSKDAQGNKYDSMHSFPTEEKAKEFIKKQKK